MKGALVLLLALVAFAAAETPREACITVYSTAFNAATNLEGRCLAAHDLSVCFANSVTDPNERILAQGFVDATQFNEDCSKFQLTTVEKVTVETADKSIHFNIGRGKDMIVSRPQAPEVISIWTVNNKIDTLATQTVTKADFASLQTTISRLQATQGGVLDGIKTDLLSWVDQRLLAVENEIRSSLASSLSELQAISNTTKANIETRVGTIDANIASLTSSLIKNITAQIDLENTGMMASINKTLSDSTSINSRINTLDSTINTKINNSISAPKATADKLYSVFQNTVLNPKLPVFRYNTWSSYSQWSGNWFCGNDATFFGGIAPSTWTDSNGYAYQMSSDKNVLRTLFNKKMTAGWNANVIANEWYSYSSTNGQVTGALFRIRNTQTIAITWRSFFYYSSYGGWAEAASVAINGNNLWTTTNNCGYCTVNVDISVPANRVSTVIFISTSGVASGSRPNILVFYNDCLNLPSGLEYVDDLDWATGGWEA